MPDRLTDTERRIAVAVARACMPPGPRLAGAGTATVTKLDDALGDMGPGALRGYGAVLRALEQEARLTNHGTPFSALTADDAEHHLVRLAEGGVGARALALAATMPLKIAYFDDAEVYRELGAPWGFATTDEPARWRQQITALQADDDVECDAVVVGTGAGGAVMARELAERGHAVLMVEEGEYYGRSAFTGHAVDNLRRFYRDAGATGSLGNCVIPIPMGRLVGGSTAINTGTCWRTPDWVLQRWVDQGLADLAPDRMEPYFERVERQLQVGPADPAYLGGVAQVIARGCGVLGYSHRPLNRNAPGCDGASVCDFGCPRGAKRSTDVSYVPAALRRGALLYTGARAERVLIEDGRAVGIEVRSVSGRHRLRVRASATVLACGTLLTPALLQRQGLHRGRRHVGRNLSIHPASTVSALFDEEIMGYTAIPQGYCIDEFQREGILPMGASAPIDMAASQFNFVGRRLMDLMEHYDRVASFGVMISDRSRGQVRLGPNGRSVVLYWFGRRERDLLQRGMALVSRVFLAAGAREVYPALHGHRVLSNAEDLQRMERAPTAAADYLLTAFHPLGTCRMAVEPRRGVVSARHEVFGIPGLYIADGSVVPSSVAVNPQVTIMALATRAADLVADRLDSPGRVPATQVA
ncbi:MAG: GMC family oxidoreductase N-terminal domain-containing protein [Acidimicrobiia bacterium]|nr:GMC family oxidoreductase N-terminal domain-containing protein [Acidimicrobiia bacterium]